MLKKSNSTVSSFITFSLYKRGFTLIELLIVITIIVTLAVVIFVALNPIKRLADSRDAKRIANTETILTAIHEYIADNKGNLPIGLSASMVETQLGTNPSGCGMTQSNCVISNAACLDLSSQLGKYLKSIPIDPGATYSAIKTGYSVTVDSNNIVSIKACGGENNQNISQSR